MNELLFGRLVLLSSQWSPRPGAWPSCVYRNTVDIALGQKTACGLKYPGSREKELADNLAQPRLSASAGIQPDVVTIGVVVGDLAFFFTRKLVA